MDAIPWSMLDNMSPWAILAFAILALIRGDLVSKRIHDEMRQDRDRWRASSEHKDTTIRILAASSTAAAAALQAIERAAASTHAEAGETT